MNLPVRILAAAGVLALVLIGLVVVESRASEAGQEVTLAMEAVDPRNLLTGHYIDLDLTQRLPAGRDCPNNMPNQGQPGWLALTRAGDRHLLSGGGATRDAARKQGEVVVRGYAWCRRVADDQGAVTLEIGVDRFHAAQVDAERMERDLRVQRPGVTAPAFAVVSIGDDGRARLKAVILNGKRADLDWW